MDCVKAHYEITRVTLHHGHKRGHHMIKMSLDPGIQPAFSNTNNMYNGPSRRLLGSSRTSATRTRTRSFRRSVRPRRQVNVIFQPNRINVFLEMWIQPQHHIGALYMGCCEVLHPDASSFGLAVHRVRHHVDASSMWYTISHQSECNNSIELSLDWHPYIPDLAVFEARGENSVKVSSFGAKHDRGSSGIRRL